MTDHRSIATGIQWVTPEMAAKWLENKYTLQRPLNVQHVGRLAADMRERRFELSPDPVVILTDGSLANGQHRLWAVLESDQTVPLLVSTGWPPSVYKIMDAGLRRSLALRVDAKWLRSKNALPTVRAALGGLQPWKAARLSEQQVVAFAVAHDDHFEPLLDMTHARGMRAPVMGACARALLAGADPSVIRRFLAITATGMSDGAHESAAVRMFVTLADAKATGRGSAGAALLYAKGVNALRNFLKGASLTQLKAIDNDSFWPLPDDSPVSSVVDKATP